MTTRLEPDGTFKTRLNQFVAAVCAPLVALAAPVGCTSSHHGREDVSQGVSLSSSAPKNRLILLGRSIAGISFGEPRRRVEKAFGRGASRRRGVVWYFAGRLQVDYGPRAMRLVVARCEVLYTGRLTARLPEAVRLLMFKPDGSFLVHDDAGGYRPLNWITSVSDRMSLLVYRVVSGAEASSAVAQAT